MLIRSRIVLSFLLVLLLIQTLAFAEDGAHGGSADNATTTSVNDSGEAVQAPRTTERYTEKGVTIDPVAIDIAPNGDIYVAEGSRAGKAVIDNRNSGLRKSNGVINDLKKTSVEDRAAQIKMLLEGEFYPEGTFTKHSDRVRLVKDTDGDGKADTSTIFADGFNDPLDGIASGVLYHDGKVYLTNIPHLWLLQDKDGDGDADKTTEGERESLSYGYGIRWAFYGHDMHGLIKSPDGRIYFSIGDRGYNVTTQEGKQLYGPDRGAVFRMWPDGSGLELFFEGLRNPQELAFDNYGNLFTGDNNSDSGDKARFIYLPEGGDSGWRQDVQSLRDRGPWNREHMWKPRDVEQFGLLQPAWIIPPLKNVGRGPSGLTHYPGTGDIFPNNGSFLMCDYPAGVRHVYVQPNGATFKVVEDSQLPTEGKTITDVTWGYDGRLYLSDWGGGWKPNPNGYIKTMVNEAAHAAQAKQIAEVKQLFADGFQKLSDAKLIELLGHADQRVRIHAQWEIAKRPANEQLTSLARNIESPELARLHAIWALGMKANHKSTTTKQVIAATLSELLADPSHHVRGQAALTIGDIAQPLSSIDNNLYVALKDSTPSVQYHAAIALGKIGRSRDVDPLLDLLDRNNNEDVAIRHAASYGLSLIGWEKGIAGGAMIREQSVRLGAVLALRRLDSPELKHFLYDKDPQVAAEAARAIYDKRIMDAMPALAALSDTLPADRMSEPVMRRVIEANVRLADLDSAMRLGKFAANANAPEMWRKLALTELDNWANERNREGVWGSWWPRPEQSIDHAKAAMMTQLPAVAGDANTKVATQARTLMQKHIKQSSPAELAEAALNPDEPEALRLGSLAMLANADQALAADTAKQLAASTDVTSPMRIAARLALIQLDLEAGQQSYADAVASGEQIEQQDAIQRLGSGATANGAIAGETFTTLTDALKRGELDPALKLDVVQVVSNNQAMPAPVRVAVQQYVEQNQTGAEKPFIRDASLAGGSIERGKEIFFHHEGAACTQCHRLDNEESQGPSLSGIGAVRDLDYLYTAVVLPNADILPGYVNENNQSNMKPMHDVLSPYELRDVLAYLASLKSDPSPYYLKLASGAGHRSGPLVTRAAADLQHIIWLPSILLGIAASLFALLMLTILGGQMAKP